MTRRRTWLVASLAVCAAVALMPAGIAGAQGGTGGGGSTSGGSTSGGGSTSTGGGGGGTGGGVKTGCTNVVTVTGTATESLAGNSFSATWGLTSCQSKTKVDITAVDLSTGRTVYQLVDTTTPTVFWSLPYSLTSYRITARAYATISGVLQTVATASTQVDTLDPLPCTVDIVETPTVGYWTVYAAIWLHHSANDCGQQGYVEMIATNMNTGVTELHVNSGLTVTYDYEGPAVSYDTPYHIEAILHSWSGEILDSSSADVRTPVRI